VYSGQVIFRIAWAKYFAVGGFLRTFQAFLPISHIER
jgi:hypothetical protein